MRPQSQSLVDIASSIFSWRPNQSENSIPDTKVLNFIALHDYSTKKTIILLKKSSRAAAHIFQAHSSRWNIEQP